MKTIITLLLLTSTAFASSYTPEQRAEAERIARSKQFVGPRLPKPKKPPSESLADAPPAKPKRQKPPAKPKHPSFDGTYYYNEDGGVIGMKGNCRPCWMVRAGIHRPKCCK